MGRVALMLRQTLASKRIEQHAQEVLGGVVAQVEQGHQQALGEGELVPVAGADGPTTVGAGEPGALGLEPQGGEGLEDAAELLWGQADEAGEAAGAALELGDREHPLEPTRCPPLPRSRSSIEPSRYRV